MERPHYSKAPITEAVIDLRVKPSARVSIEALEQVYRDDRDVYPAGQRLVIAQGQIELGERVSASARQEEVGMAFTSADSKQAVQARVDGFTFSRLAPYDRWEPFRDEAQRLWARYRERIAPAEVTRLALRYINRFDLPGTAVELKDYFRTSPEISADLPQTVNSFLLHLVLPLDDVKAQVFINQTIVPPKTADVMSIVLDIDVFRGVEVPRHEDEIWGYFEQLHDQKNKVFEACITDRTRDLIR